MKRQPVMVPCTSELKSIAPPEVSESELAVLSTNELLVTETVTDGSL
jgi:hypothetical protein